MRIEEKDIGDELIADASSQTENLTETQPVDENSKSKDKKKRKLDELLDEKINIMMDEKIKKLTNEITKDFRDQLEGWRRQQQANPQSVADHVDDVALKVDEKISNLKEEKDEVKNLKAQVETLKRKIETLERRDARRDEVRLTDNFNVFNSTMVPDTTRNPNFDDIKSLTADEVKKIKSK